MRSEPRFPIGTKYMTRGKAPRLCTVVDYLVTRNMDGDIVKTRYASTHEVMGQTVTDWDVPDATVAIGVSILVDKQTAG